LCTHIIISFFEITANGDVQFFDQYGESLIRNAIQKAKGWRSSNPNLKILMAIGGAKGPNLPFAWNSVSSNQQKRSDFAMNIARRIEEFQLDGVDIDWEYPNNSPGEPNKEKPEEKGYFTSLLRDIKQRIGSSKILTTAIGAGSWRGEASYEVANIFSICDFVNIMTYDMHGTWRDTTGLHNALQMTNNSEVTVKDSINYLLGKSIDKKKIIVGIATYGKIFYLKSGSNYIGAPMFNGNDIEGKKDAFSNFEMCSKLRSNELTSVYAGNQMVPYAFNQSVWVSYENVISVTEKANYIKNNGFGGAMFW
jgi:GH18 family chitinase